MAQEYPRHEAQSSFPAMDALTAGLDTLTSRVKQFGEFNSESLAKAREINRHWMERAAAEAQLTMEMNSQISSVHTFSDAMNLYQQWAGQRLKAAGEDVNYALSAGRELMEAASRAFAGNGSGQARHDERAPQQSAGAASSSYAE
jgi:hypothetical protein